MVWKIFNAKVIHSNLLHSSKYGLPPIFWFTVSLWCSVVALASRGSGSIPEEYQYYLIHSARGIVYESKNQITL